jgi:acetyl esterase/lipase
MVGPFLLAFAIAAFLIGVQNIGRLLPARAAVPAPRASRRKPAVLFVHGGGWTQVAPPEWGEHLMAGFRAAGYEVAEAFAAALN